MEQPRRCAQCLAFFSPYHSGDRFCSDYCRHAWHDARRRSERREARTANDAILQRQKNFYENFKKCLCHESFSVYGCSKKEVQG